LIEACLRAHPERVIGRFPAYARLRALAETCRGAAVRYLSDDFLGDCLMWFHIALLGETVRRKDSRVLKLMDRQVGYGYAERRELLKIIHELITGVLGRYRLLAEHGQVELALNPYAHPILPLLIDPKCAREASPELPLPQSPEYPGGIERARWHVREALRVFKNHFRSVPTGCWPSEGALSRPALEVLGEHGFAWVASGAGVLRHSRSNDPSPHRLYTLGEGLPACVFRDDGLSDRIGFEYARWHGDDAAADLVQHLLAIKRGAPHPERRLAAIIMDGENAWEYFPENGYYFLDALYRMLIAEPQLKLTTFSEALQKLPREPLDKIVAGSWIYGTLSTWIGDPQKNRAWDLLIAAKRAFDAASANGALNEAERAEASRLLAHCEASDWCWWYGRDTDPRTAREFDTLYRHHLQALYRAMKLPVPDDVLVSLVAAAPPSGELTGAMRRSTP
jgi:alpha-amylase/alpha-mannosidase (GH57 family)